MDTHEYDFVHTIIDGGAFLLLFMEINSIDVIFVKYLVKLDIPANSQGQSLMR